MVKRFLSGIANKVLPNRLKVVLEGERSGATKRFREFLESDEANKPILKMEVCRMPLQTGLKIVGNALTFGKFSQKAKDLGYDDVYHNYTLIYTDPHIYKLEKNHVVEIFKAKQADFKGEKREVKVPQGLTIRKLIEGASHKDPRFWKYDPSSDNCQRFQQEIIEDNHLDNNEEIKKFVKPQEAKELIGTLGSLAKMPHLVTKTASVADRFYHGDSVIKRKRRGLGRVRPRDSKGRFI